MHTGKLLFLSLSLTAAMALAGCTAAQQRGMDGAVYVSTSRPAVSIAVRDIPLATAGRGTGLLYDPSRAAPVNLTVRTAVYARGADKPVAAATHAELPSPRWTWVTIHPRVGATHHGPEIIGGQGFTAFTYLVPRANDPFAGIAGEPTDDESVRERPAWWLARYFAANTNFNNDKIILEYREPAPEGLTSLGTIPYGMSEAIAAFEQRAREAFVLGAPAEGVRAQDGYPTGVRWRYMSDLYLGDVLERDPVSRYNF